MDGVDPGAGEPQADKVDPFAIAARRLKAQSPADATPASGPEPLDAALSCLDEAEVEIRRARDGLAVALGAARYG